MANKLLGLEIVVNSLDRSLEVLVDVLHLALIDRRSSIDPVGELALVDAGTVILTLIEPKPFGPGRVLANRTPCVSQLVLETDPSGVASNRQRCESAGLALLDLPGDRFMITGECVAGVLGISTAIVVVESCDE